MADEFKLIPFPRLNSEEGVTNAEKLWKDLDGLMHAAARAAQTTAAAELDPNLKFQMVSKLRSVAQDTCELCLSLADAVDAPEQVKRRLQEILARLRQD